MTDLSKQQLILLALLVSFVTSLATGIVTVSLMDQAPAGVAQTINQVIEKTIQEAVPQDTASVSAPMAYEDQLALAVQAVSSSTVRIRGASSAFTGLGLVLTKQGIIVTDKSALAQTDGYMAVLADGTSIPLSVVQSQINGDVVFLAPSGIPSQPASFIPASPASSTPLGEAAFSLSGTSTQALAQGIITQSPSGAAGTSTDALVLTSIPVSKALPGSPLFDMSGNIIGLRTSSLPTDASGSAFYPIGQIENVIPSF